MNNVHDDAPVIFQSRWAMSYLCGPLTRNQIKTLMDPVRSKYSTATAPDAKGGATASSARVTATWPGPVPGASSRRPVVPGGIREKFLAISERVPDDYQLEYRPGLVGKGKIHFVRKADGIDVWQTCFLLQPIKDTPPDDIWQGATLAQQAAKTEDQPDERGVFADLPAELSRDKSYTIFARQLKEHLYREGSLKLWRCEPLEITSNPDEQEADFRKRLEPKRIERLAGERDRVQRTHEKKLADTDTRVQKAQATLRTRKWQVFTKIGSAILVFADYILAGFKINLPGRRRSIDPALRSIATGSGQQSNAKADLENALQEKGRLAQRLQDDLRQLDADYSATGLKVEQLELKPQKGDIEADEVSLVWLPFRISPAAAAAEPVYQMADP